MGKQVKIRLHKKNNQALSYFNIEQHRKNKRMSRVLVPCRHGLYSSWDATSIFKAGVK